MIQGKFSWFEFLLVNRATVLKKLNSINL